MSDEHLEWKEAIGLAAIILAVCFGVSTCRYVDHRIHLEEQLIKKETHK